MRYSHKILEKIGLSAGEIAVYTTGLSLGPSPASAIAKDAKLSRPLVYHLLELLEQKGLVSKIGPKHGHRFAMEPPVRLKGIIERRRKELEKIEVELDQVSAELQSLYSPKSNPSRIRFYEGVEGLKNVAQEALKVKGGEMRVILPNQDIFKLFDETFIHYWTGERANSKFIGRSIWSYIPNSPLLRSKLQERRMAPSGANFSAGIVLYDNKVVVFASPSEPFIFVVESDAFSGTMNSMFETVWGSSAPF